MQVPRLNSKVQYHARAALIGAVVALAFALPAEAQNTRSSDVMANRAIAYQGKLVRPDGSVPNGTVPMTIKILSPEPSLCVLWAETQTLDVKQGTFSAELGHDTHRINGVNGGGAADFKQVFINNPGLTIAATQCASGASYTPTVSDDRLLVASFVDNGTVVEISSLPIKSVPYALQADQLNGYGVANLAKISGSGSGVVYSPAEIQTLKDLLGGDLFFDMKSRVVKNVANPVDPQDAATKAWVQTQISASGGGTVTAVSVGGLPLSVINASTTPQISIAQANGSQAGYISATDWNTFNNKQAQGNYITALTGEVTAAGPGSAAATIAASAVTTAKIADGNVTTVKINDKAVTLVKLQDIATTSLLGRSAAGTGVPEVISVGAGLSLSGGTLSATTGGTVSNVAGLGPISVASGSTTPQVSIAQATTSTDGYLSSTDWNTFNGKQAAFGSQAQNSVYAGPATGGAGAPGFRALIAADIPNLDTGKLTTGILGVARGGTGVAPAGAGDANKVFGANAAGNAGELKAITQGTGISVTHGVGTITIAATGGTGTVTSVGASAPLSVSAATTTPQITLTQATTSTDGYLSSTDWNTFNNKQSTSLGNANILVGSAGGVATARAPSGDLTMDNLGAFTIAGSAVTSSKIANGAVALVDMNTTGSAATNSGLLVHDGTNFANKTCGANQVLIWTVANGWSCNAAVLAESDPKIGSNTTNMLSKWDGSALVASAIHESSGNVGVGTTSPGSKLEVNGNVIFKTTGGLGNGIQLNLSNASGYGAIDFNTPGGLNGQFLSTGSGYSNGIFTGNQVALTSYLNGGSTTLVAGGTGSYINFATGGYAPSNERLRIDSNGNVGIGTTSPSSKLHVVGSGAVGGEAVFESSTSYNRIKIAGVNGAGVNDSAFLSLIDQNNENTFIGVVGTAGIGSGNVGDLRFGVNNLERMRISKSTGNVGIGTTSPSSKLEVTGTARATSVSGASASITTAAIDFANGNAVTTSYDCAGGSLSLANIRDGGSYIVAVTSTTTAQCSFNTSVTGTDAATVTYRFSTPNGARIASSHSMYNLTRIGNVIYVSWNTGFL